MNRDRIGNASVLSRSGDAFALYCFPFSWGADTVYAAQILAGRLFFLPQSKVRMTVMFSPNAYFSSLFLILFLLFLFPFIYNIWCPSSCLCILSVLFSFLYFPVFQSFSIFLSGFFEKSCLYVLWLFLNRLPLHPLSERNAALRSSGAVVVEKKRSDFLDDMPDSLYLCIRFPALAGFCEGLSPVFFERIT